MRTPELEAAFRATTYRVDVGDEVFALRIGEAHPAFSSWLRRQGIVNWGIVTACNPGGRLAPDENAERSRCLEEALDERGWRHAPACNRADSGDWPDEVGFCVLGADEGALSRLAVAFGQAAIVVGVADDGAGQLVWMDGQ